ncbi:chemotaxis protein CheD [Stigmatella aurantiaca]|uniref:Probable chemoreceptor glutamine deamidase CheD n=1 Tax=Stigmatella aurantiaca (strain DW4/3-1) TaxID=378806 RepID=Q08QI6_STIAD|nr:GAF domain-containing protein [Stigmatella aurantiaca]ADO72502.1 Chemotaxis family protein CheD [Stigmatella aurantiaca DW4/3-1]EAU62748.1 CheD family [Stigmatella aurantiaca DW4/3-1]
MSTATKKVASLRPRAAAALQRLTACTQPSQALEVLGEIVSQLIGCEEYALLALDPVGRSLSHVTSMGLPREHLQNLLPLRGILGQVALGGVPHFRGRTSAAGASAHEAGLTACVPIRRGERIHGVLALFRLLPQKWGLEEEDLELLTLFSENGVLAFSAEEAVLPPEQAVAPGSSVPSAGGRTLYLHPGDIFVSGTSAEVTTVLGSSIAVSLWDAHLRRGGLSHFLLPKAPALQVPSIRYGDLAIPSLVDQLSRLGSQRQHLQAGMFGGAILEGPGPETGASLGHRNTQLARTLLRELDIPLVAEDVGGAFGRKLRFRTEDGTVLLKTLRGG